MTVDHAYTVQARMDCLPQAMAVIEAFCRERGVTRNDGLRLALVFEELFTNTVMHGHGGDCDAPVRVGLRADPSEVGLSYEDTAPPFDPWERVARSASELEAGLSERPIGQIGIALVVNMATRFSYVREDGWNRLQLALQREA
jgi:anti-sigma regulatory factor (Ser/Thr protein kinase)